jgi:hypothetical protein
MLFRVLTHLSLARAHRHAQRGTENAFKAKKRLKGGEELQQFSVFLILFTSF